ncbi:hypothetical protein K470DRAFT_255280 [Piedraia hortae CBS 480.64]|uniref:DNA repair protein rad5 n=1 Tax=Piedraia hortae CBS 480.64 TaxID=1314780 RepID=A0A6A7C7E3_9PEZI|nr:hypothetical protein K470DRAFT_255280 [Piedraia hortae CBS 480.64]
MDERRAKRRRFFADSSPCPPTPSEITPPTNEVPLEPSTRNDSPSRAASPDARIPTPSSQLDLSTLTCAGDETNWTVDELLRGDDEKWKIFQQIIGNGVDTVTTRRLYDYYGGNATKAVNAYYDGTWAAIQSRGSIRDARSAKQHVPIDSASIPKRRYIGALGVAGWTTRSGHNLLRPKDRVIIERTKQQIVSRPGRGGRVRPIARKTQDVIVRFANANGEEVGRLEKDSASWISTLIDQKVCVFEGTCVYAPERLRTNDTVYLQLRCFLRGEVFRGKGIVKPVENNRLTGLFEAKESEDERDLRLRQFGLVKLFNEIDLKPCTVSEMTARHKREGILKATEVMEQYDLASTQAGKGTEDGEEEEGKEVEQDQLDALYKKAQLFDFETPEAEPAETFGLSLRKYQKQALHWMLNKEKNEKDEQREQSMHPLWEEYSWPTKDVDDEPLPVVEGQESFYVNPYSGEMSLEFPVQEQDCLGGILADEMGLGKTIEMLSLIHSNPSPEQQATCGPSYLPRLTSRKQQVESAPATTLVVAPMSLLAQWASEVEKASKPGTIKALVYYGDEKNADLQSLCCAANTASAPNVIITSYGIVLSEFGKADKRGGLFSLEYWRIIMDEAHVIKNRQSKTAKACYELAARHRWVLTGTPIVNRLEDLFSLVRFLRVEPWSNFSFWKTFITTPFENGEFMRALDVVQTVVEPLVLRRTKDMKMPNGEALVSLPPRTITIEQVELSQPEQDVYHHIFSRAKRTFAQNEDAGTLMKSYTTIFAQILRLRQSCCHPILTRNKAIVAEEEAAEAAVDAANGLADDMDLETLLENFKADSGEKDASTFGAHALTQIQAEAEAECPICCEEPMQEQSVTGCWHSACKKCLLDYIDHQASKGEVPRCFNCREAINARDVFEIIRHGDDDDRISLRRVKQLSSAKIHALLSRLKPLRISDPKLKCVVFSQFTSFLDLVGPALNTAKIKTLRFDGSMSQRERAHILKEFESSTEFTALLLSLRAGGVGLNLTCAKRVFMMDPWWSFAVEAQAIDRVHRMGQTDHVHVTRFVCKGSIEEKMLRVQERKKFM